MYINLNNFYLESIRGKVKQHLVDVAGLEAGPSPEILLLAALVLRLHRLGGDSL